MYILYIGSLCTPQCTSISHYLDIYISCGRVAEIEWWVGPYTGIMVLRGGWVWVPTYFMTLCLVYCTDRCLQVLNEMDRRGRLHVEFIPIPTQETFHFSNTPWCIVLSSSSRAYARTRFQARMAVGLLFLVITLLLTVLYGYVSVDKVLSVISCLQLLVG
jgi:hypothetical protein